MERVSEWRDHRPVDNESWLMARQVGSSCCGGGGCCFYVQRTTNRNEHEETRRRRHYGYSTYSKFCAQTASLQAHKSSPHVRNVCCCALQASSLKEGIRPLGARALTGSGRGGCGIRYLATYLALKPARKSKKKDEEGRKLLPAKPS